MEEKILAVMDTIAESGGMYRAVEKGLVQAMIGRSALAWQERVENGDQQIVGVNCYTTNDNETNDPSPATERPDSKTMDRHVESLRVFKRQRDQEKVSAALSNIARAANSKDDNVFATVVAGTAIGVTHGETVACLRRELGFGQPLIVE